MIVFARLLWRERKPGHPYVKLLSVAAQRVASWQRGRFFCRRAANRSPLRKGTTSVVKARTAAASAMILLAGLSDELTTRHLIVILGNPPQTRLSHCFLWHEAPVPVHRRKSGQRQSQPNYRYTPGDCRRGCHGRSGTTFAPGLGQLMS